MKAENKRRDTSNLFYEQIEADIVAGIKENMPDMKSIHIDWNYDFGWIMVSVFFNDPKIAPVYFPYSIIRNYLKRSFFLRETWVKKIASRAAFVRKNIKNRKNKTNEFRRGNRAKQSNN